MRTACSRAALVLLAASNAAAFMDSLPLEVLSITPIANDGSDASQQISGRDALSVTFSRAVIALGSDFGPEDQAPPADKVPFSIGVNVPGRLRWVTTFSARFDPSVDWPTDLEFDLTINAALSAFDGTPLSNAEAMPLVRHFTTPHVSAWLGSITSATAAALTDNTWLPDIIDGELSGAKEMPPDGIMTIGFSHEVDRALLAAEGLSLRDQAGAELAGRGAPRLVVLPCARSWDEKCVSVRVEGGLALGTAYSVVVPAGTRYHPLCGATQAETSFHIAGLLQFQLPFVQGLEIPSNQYSQSRPSYRRW
eukprot:SAG11_NODE_1111_length_5823_cov_2.384172_3_plen_308_part_00